MTDVKRRVVVVGAGMLGVNVAFAATNEGHDVTIIDEHNSVGIGATLNLGAIRLTGRRPGRELDVALAARRSASYRSPIRCARRC